MNKQEVINLFDELLISWYWSEECCISNMSVNISKDRDELEELKEEFKNKFMKAIGE